MAEVKGIKFKAKNGQILVARNEVQANAFKEKGLVEVKEKEEKK